MMKSYFKVLNICIAFVFFSCKTKQGNNALTVLKGSVFGTSYQIKYFNEVNYQKPIDSLFALINKSLSTYIPTSDISKINRGDTTVVVDAFFVEVFKKAKKIYKQTDGYFDPTMGKLIDAYGFGSGKKRVDLSEMDIFKLRQAMGFDKVMLKKNKVYRQNPNIELNVNAFAKGYGVDIIGRFLENKNIFNYLVEIGGEIRARGNKNNNSWKVAVEKPNEDGTRSIHKIIELNDESMATSGNYRKYKLNNKGQKIVHTINPKTGLAYENNLLSVSVLLKGDCANADAYATAFLAMGFEKTKLFLQKYPELKVILLYSDKDNKLKEFTN
ncbi:MAG: FAD:protein FMN transferase [Tenacibaculum sp.]